MARQRRGRVLDDEWIKDFLGRSCWRLESLFFDDGFGCRSERHCLGVQDDVRNAYHLQVVELAFIV